MRLNIRILHTAIAIALLWLTSCSKPSAGTLLPPDITGEWKLESAGSLDGSVIVKSGEAVEISVYLSFGQDGDFELYQRLDELHFRSYTGTWQLDGNILDGLYGGKQSTPWACSYKVSLEDNGDALVMTALSPAASSGASEAQDTAGEILRYARTPIPEHIRSGAVPAGSSF